MEELINSIQEKYRQRQDYVSATTRLILQCKATCRRFCDGDKTEAEKLFNAIRKGEYEEENIPLALWLQPLLEALSLLEAHRLQLEKDLKKLAKELPVIDWLGEHLGIGELTLAKIIGEAGNLMKYDTVAKFWKRMGLGMVGNERQRRVSDPELAILHGYNPNRRALMWNVGAGIIKAQIRKDPDDENLRISKGDLGRVYLERKAYELNRTDLEKEMTPAWAHNRAQRYTEKRFLRLLWAEWRKANVSLDAIDGTPSAEKVAA